MVSGKTVLANGVFDILHMGHLLYLEEAAKMGNWLAVGITRDAHVNKGPGRPVNGELHRLALIQALKIVDEAFLCDDPIEALEYIKPDIFVKGKDYRGKIEKRHADHCRNFGIEIRFTNTPLMSSSKIIEAMK